MTRSNGRSMRFEHVKVENWRNFAKAEADLAGRVFLVGPNASGKSNFLDVFRFMQDIVATGGGFRAAVERRGGVSKLRCLAARQQSDVLIRISMGAPGEPALWVYELQFNQDKKLGPVVRRERVTHRGEELLNRPQRDDLQDEERLTQTHLEQVHLNQGFRQVAETLRSTRYLHIVPQLIREPDRSSGRQADPFGGDFLEQVAQTRANTRKARLRRIAAALKVAVPQLKELEYWREPVKGTSHLRGKYKHWRPQGAWRTEEEFSDGTLRLLGLLWALLDGRGTLLLEEPELSLHPDVVRFVPQMFARIQRQSGRQILVSTHSTDLLRDDGIGLDEVLLLRPGHEGTTVTKADAFTDIVALLEGGVSLADAVMPKTRPESVEQLPLFSSR